jgi:hypothetical protein
MKEIDYDDVINRMGFFKDRANLSARAVSYSLGYSEQFMKRIESKSVELKVSTLLDFFDVVGITAQDFFYLGKQYSAYDKNLLELFSNLSTENKNIIVDLMKKLK